MEQLPLDIFARCDPTLDNFVAGSNREALARVRALAQGEPGEAIVYLWGDPGSGRSHLLRAAARAGQGRYYAPGEPPLAQDAPLVAVDEVEQLDAAGQIALFMQINRAREARTRVLVCGGAAPAALALRSDVRSRLGWGLVYQLRPLSDERKKEHLRAEAARRGLQLGEEVLAYLLTRLPRDLAYLNGVLDHLDRHSLARQRALTLPLVREALARLPPRD